MKTSYCLIAGLVALFYWRHHRWEGAEGATHTEEAQRAAGFGVDFLPDLWGMLEGENLSSPSFHNLLPGPNADPGGSAASKLRLQPGWDGSL